MVHPFFQTIAKKPYFADACAAKVSCYCHNVTPKFTQVFPIFFPTNGHFDDDMESWLDVISSEFEFDMENENGNTIGQVVKLFHRLGFQPRNPKNRNMFNFWLYLVWIYKKLLNVGYYREDNVFSFMKGCSIYDVKVVIFGNEPAKHVPSSGFAFHHSVSPSTTKLLDFADSEINIVCNNLNDHRMSLPNREFDEVKEMCCLSGWIEQGVLLLNSRLTFEENGDIREAWELFTNFLLKYLSDKVGNVVFLLLGNANANKTTLIDRTRNMVMKLYHPAHYTYNPQRLAKWNLDWDTMLPFINANLYLWQVSRGDHECMVDWSSIGWVKNRITKRLSYWVSFFSSLIQTCSWLKYGKTMHFNGMLVRRNLNGFLTLLNA